MKSLHIYKLTLEKLIGFKSVSTVSKSEPEMQSTITYLSDLFKDNSFKVSLLNSKLGNPIILAEYQTNPQSPTWLIYGHYDVQPAENQSGWNSKPFELIEKSNRLWGRGAIDNKGQVLIHMLTIFDLIKSGKLKYNIKFLIEGNEETGSQALLSILPDHKTELACDHILISDGDLVGDNPVIEVGFRGMACATLVFRTALNTVHSGEYANAIPNAAHELSKLVASIFGVDDEILIPGFNEAVPTKRLQELPLDFLESQNRLGYKKQFTNTNRNYHETIGLYPSISVTGFKSGYIDEGYANIIPDTAEAKFNIRVGQGQDPEKLMQLFAAYIALHTPSYVSADLQITNSIKAEQLNIEAPELKQISVLLEEIYNHKVVYKYVGGTLPIIGAFTNILGVSPFSIPLANEDSNMHGANENFSIENIENGFRFSSKLFSN